MQIIQPGLQQCASYFYRKRPKFAFASVSSMSTPGCSSFDIIAIVACFPDSSLIGKTVSHAVGLEQGASIAGQASDKTIHASVTDLCL